VNSSYTLFAKLSFFAFEFRYLCRNLTKGAARSTNRLTELQWTNWISAPDSIISEPHRIRKYIHETYWHAKIQNFPANDRMERVEFFLHELKHRVPMVCKMQNGVIARATLHIARKPWSSLVLYMRYIRHVREHNAIKRVLSLFALLFHLSLSLFPVTGGCLFFSSPYFSSLLFCSLSSVV